MTETPGCDDAKAPGSPEVKRRHLNISLVWLVPIVAVLVGVSMVIHNVRTAGPKINVSFSTAEGLEANKTLVKYKNVVIGKVASIALNEDRDQVDVTLQLDASAKPFTAQDSRFWVVRPRIGANGVSGVDTLLSGAFIGADAGSSQTLKSDFIGLESPPAVTYRDKGTQFTLHTEELGSLDIGSSVYYRRIPVGQVMSYALAEDGKSVDIQIFVNAPNDQFVTRDTRFWNASGVEVNLTANGLKVNTQSLSSILAGGIAFVEPRYSPNPQRAKERAEFTLFADQETALAPPDGASFYIQMRFDQSLRGLSVNAPVEFLGVNLGRVVSIDLDYDPVTKTFPTIIGAVIYPQRLGRAHEQLNRDGDENDKLRPQRVLGTMIERGLRAQARSGNLLTGQLYIAMDFVQGAKPVKFDITARPSQIPTVPGSLDKLQVQLESIVDKISKLPLDQIAGNLNGSLVALQGTLKQVNGQVLPQLQDTLVQTKRTLTEAGNSVAEDSPQRQQFGAAMDEVQRTARSVRTLTDFLSRHPEALIRGRAKDQPLMTSPTSRENNPQ